MSDEHTEERSEPRVTASLPVSVSVSVSHDTQKDADKAKQRSPNSSKQGNERPPEKDGELNVSAVSKMKLAMKSQLPALPDDAEVGVQKQHIVTRDGKPDLMFSGSLLASAAPASDPNGQWQEYRIYQTTGDKHVFSKVTRYASEKDDDTYEAEVFDPSPSSVPSQLFRSAREIARNKPLTWMDAAVAFFGYDPLAKVLYRKLSVRFEEQIS